MLIKALNYTLTIILDNCVSTEAHSLWFINWYHSISYLYGTIVKTFFGAKIKHKLNSEIITQSDEVTPPQFFRDPHKQFVLLFILICLQFAKL